MRKVGRAVTGHIDCTKRVHHIASPIALAMTKRMFQLDWINHRRIRRYRVLNDIGREVLRRGLGISVHESGKTISFIHALPKQ